MEPTKRRRGLIAGAAAVLSAAGLALGVADAALPPGRASLVEGLNTFGLNLYGELKVKDKGNLVFSPFSLHQALGMTYTGAKRKTAAQMAKVLGAPKDKDAFLRTMSEFTGILDEKYTTRGGEAFEFEMANGLFGQSGFRFLADFTGGLKRLMGAGWQSVDFKADPEAGRAVVNRWVADHTRQRIKELLPRNSLNRETRLVLTNTIFFKGSWQDAFDEAATQKLPFYPVPGRPVQVDMMRQQARYQYEKAKEYQVAVLPYEGGPYEMAVFLPDEKSSLETMEKRLSPEDLTKKGQGAFTLVNLQLPKFKTVTAFSAKKSLKALGMEEAFKPYHPATKKGADFSGITGNRLLVISDVVHQAVVAVDEAGTEAAAAAAVTMVEATSVQKPPVPVLFHVNRPFLWVIRHAKTGAVMFMGREVLPKAGQ